MGSDTRKASFCGGIYDVLYIYMAGTSIRWPIAGLLRLGASLYTWRIGCVRRCSTFCALHIGMLTVLDINCMIFAHSNVQVKYTVGLFWTLVLVERFYMKGEFLLAHPMFADLRPYRNMRQVMGRCCGC